MRWKRFLCFINFSYFQVTSVLQISSSLLSLLFFYFVLRAEKNKQFVVFSCVREKKKNSLHFSSSVGSVSSESTFWENKLFRRWLFLPLIIVPGKWEAYWIFAGVMFDCNPLKMLYLYLKGEDLDVPFSLFLRIMYSILSNRALHSDTRWTFAPLSASYVRPVAVSHPTCERSEVRGRKGVVRRGKNHLLLQLRLKSETSLWPISVWKKKSRNINVDTQFSSFITRREISVSLSVKSSWALKYSAASDLYFLFTASTIFRPRNPQLQTHTCHILTFKHVSSVRLILCSLSSGLRGRYVSCSMSCIVVKSIKSSCLHKNLAPTTAVTLRTSC